MLMCYFGAVWVGGGVCMKVIWCNDVLIFENQYIIFVLNIIKTKYFFYGLSACESM